MNWLCRGLLLAPYAAVAQLQNVIGCDCKCDNGNMPSMKAPDTGVGGDILSAGSMCSPDRIAHPSIFGLQILDLAISHRKNYTFDLLNIPGGPTETYAPMNLCHVSVTYAHPGWNDKITVTVYMPTENWNGRFQGTGGGGFVTGGESLNTFYMIPGLRDGFAVATTNGGHGEDIAVHSVDAGDWALLSPGNVNLPLLADFAHVALHDMAEIGKAITTSFYGVAPHHSYFQGGSTGGRQAIMMAQKYPRDYDGIVSICPAINWAKFIMAGYWPQFVMNQLGVYPHGCELDAVTAEAIAACDALDGVEDGYISLPGRCDFDALSVVGKEFECAGGRRGRISREAATIANAAWTGPRSSAGKFQWYGIGKDALLGDNGQGIASTQCDEDGTCRGVPFAIPVSWIRHFITKDPDFDITAITHAEWDLLFHRSVSEYESLLSASYADLSEFRAAGGKLLSWHGMRDAVIPFNGSVHYYNSVLQEDEDAQAFFRLFLAPGAEHSGWVGPVPSDLVDTVVDWVERQEAPETLRVKGPDGNGRIVERDLCMYPSVQEYVSGDPSLPPSFRCVG
ncbi:Tannase/feruloyl esterase [Aspergillus pseudoustus]|uniref:Carboxylic ester hydrolase n=1 Tax=Aspergillus pseudoustus TaxID=1810923 RepID=A0ABR4JHZ3_9EURO